MKDFALPSRYEDFEYDLKTAVSNTVYEYCGRCVLSAIYNKCTWAAPNQC